MHSARAFFLNACGSYREGIDLIEKGSVAGAVTLEKVLDRQATRVGTAFAQLVIHGYNIAQALRLARRRSVMNKVYAAVGDATHTLSQGCDNHSFPIEIITESEQKYMIKIEAFSLDTMGGIYQPYLPDEKGYLFANKAKYTISESDLIDYLSRAASPIIFDNQYYWSDELYDKLSEEREEK